MSPTALNVVETAFLLLYAVGQFAIGPLGDRFGAKPLLIFAFIGAAGLMAACGSASTSVWLASAWGVNGLLQGGVFPLNMKALAPWLDKSSRGAVLGLWTTCQQVGGVASTALTGYLASQFGWRTAFLTLAPVVGTAGLALTFLPTKQVSADSKAPENSASTGPRPSFSDVLHIPNLLRLGGAYFCVKLVRYIMMFWLTFYLQSSRGFDAATAAYASLVFDIGGALGNVACGAVSDSLFGGRRIVVTALMCGGCALSLLAFAPLASAGLTATTVMMFIVGMMIAGPDSVLGGVACTDVCDAAGVGSSVLTTASGIVNGVGSVGAILQGTVVLFVTETYGWTALFHVLAVLCAAAVIFLVPLLRVKN